MTIELCANFCLPTYGIFGIEYSGECYCGNSLGTGSVVAPSTDCNMACGGDHNEICGAGNRLSIYLKDGYSVPAAPQHVPKVHGFAWAGCYREGNNTRALSGATKVDYTNMSVEICAEFCIGNSLLLMGVEYGGECYCGSVAQWATTGSVLASTSDCNMLCAGNASEYCGGPNRLDLYGVPAGGGMGG